MKRERVPLLRVELRFEQDVVLTRQRAKQVAALLHFGEQEQTRIATAVSEIARNAFRYAGKGVTEFALVQAAEDAHAPMLEITVTDSGPGIPHLDDVLHGRYRSTTGMGMGIVGSRRLMDRFAISSEPGAGTQVVLAQILPRESPVPTAADLARLSEALAKGAADSPSSLLQEQNRELLQTMDELAKRGEELARVNQELAETNRGVVALYAELDEKAEALRKASELKSRFLSNVSHEFRTPLNSILSLSRILLERVDGPLAPEQERQVQFIHKSAETLTELINDLLDLAKIEAGKTDVHAAEFEVSELFATLRGMMRPLLSTDAVTLSFEDPGPLPPLFSDEGKVAQILRNFISNALKFTERGEVRVSAARTAPGMITFWVADSGIGIPPEHHDRIFEEFSQVEGPLQRKAKGTGLGLPLSKKLAGLLGGALAVESLPGKGSTFRVTVPAVYPDAKAPPEGLELRWRVEPGAVPVLVVEDDAASRAIYERFLEGSGFQAIPARTLSEARVALQRLKPVAVILDIELEGEQSWDLLSELKAEPATRGVPVLVVSNHELDNQALAQGADLYQRKPVDRAWLLGALRSFTDGSPPRPKALIVDDDEVARYLLRRALADHPIDVAEVGNVSEALARLQKERPTVIFLDLVMPGQSGFEMLELLRKDPATRELPVIIHTSKQLTDEERQRLASAVTILPKLSEASEQRAAAVKAALEKAGVLAAGAPIG